MPDISKCDDTECPRKNTCYRFMSADSYWQSYFVPSPRINEKCDQYMELRKK